MTTPIQHLLAAGFLASVLACGVAAPGFAQAPPTYDVALAHYNLGDFTGARAGFDTLAKSGDPRAQYILGLMSLEGKGGPRDEAAALGWLRKSADQGNISAMFDLALMYDQGEGIAEDNTEAVRWYRLAAERGNANSQFNLGQHYMDGDGVAADVPTAIGWWRKAADQGSAQAQFNLGVAYANGLGVVADRVEAYKWLLLSAAAGNKNAAGAVPTIKAAITTEQATQGEAKAAQWKPAQ